MRNEAAQMATVTSGFVVDMHAGEDGRCHIWPADRVAFLGLTGSPARIALIPFAGIHPAVRGFTFGHGQLADE